MTFTDTPDLGNGASGLLAYTPTDIINLPEPEPAPPDANGWYACAACGKGFSTPAGVRMHRDRIHAPEAVLKEREAKRRASLGAAMEDNAELARMLAEQHARVAELDRQRSIADAIEKAKTRTTPISHVDCRVFGHDWHDIEADRNPAIGWYMKMQCARCGTTRSDIINGTGTVERRSYKYADGYKDTDHWKRTDWRMQYLRRVR